MGFSISNRAQQFDKWTNSEENYNKALKGEKPEEFQVVDMNGDKPYNQALKDFAQEYINIFDKNADGKWNFDEFMDMSCGELIEQEMESYKEFCDEEQLTDIKKDLKNLLAPSNKMYFDNLNLDDKKDEINAGEFATMLLMGDLNLDKYMEYGISSDSVDGKVDYSQYQAISGDTTTKWIQNERKDFYDYFYADNE